MRDFKTYRYIVSNPKLDFKQHLSMRQPESPDPVLI